MKFTAPRSLFSLLGRKVNQYSSIAPTALSLHQYFEFDKITNANLFEFVRRELLVRFAALIQEFERSQTLFNMPIVRRVADTHCESFERLLIFEHAKNTASQMERFNNQLRTILKHHRNTVEEISKAIGELQQTTNKNHFGVDDAILHACIDRILLSQIAIRTLQNQYLSTFDLPIHNKVGECSLQRVVGVIDSGCDVAHLVRDAYNTASELCDDFYQCTPALHLNVIDPAKTPTCITAEPSYLYHIIFEILKNSMRATIEHANGNNAGDVRNLPPIKVQLEVNGKYLVIKICDQGGGIPLDVINRLFNYTYTTVTPPVNYITPFAGFGTGLPVSRLYARYFSGDLILSSVDGLGTNASIYTRLDPHEAVEFLPTNSPTNRLLHYVHQPTMPDVPQMRLDVGLVRTASPSMRFNQRI